MKRVGWRENDGELGGKITQVVEWLRKADPKSGGSEKRRSRSFAGRLTSSGNKNKCDSITGSIVTAADRPLSIEDRGVDIVVDKIYPRRFYL